MIVQLSMIPVWGWRHIIIIAIPSHQSATPSGLRVRDEVCDARMDCTNGGACAMGFPLRRRYCQNQESPLNQVRLKGQEPRE